MPVLFPTTGEALFEIRRRELPGLAARNLTPEAVAAAEQGLHKAQALASPLRPSDMDPPVWAVLKLAVEEANRRRLGIYVQAVSRDDESSEVDGNSLQGAAYLGYLLIALREELGTHSSWDPHFVVSASAAPHESALSPVSHLSTKFQAVCDYAAARRVPVTFLYCGEPDFPPKPGVTTHRVGTLSDLAQALVGSMPRRGHPSPEPVAAPPPARFGWLFAAALGVGTFGLVGYRVMGRDSVQVSGAAPATAASAPSALSEPARAPAAPLNSSVDATTAAAQPSAPRRRAPLSAAPRASVSAAPSASAGTASVASTPSVEFPPAPPVVTAAPPAVGQKAAPDRLFERGTVRGGG